MPYLELYYHLVWSTKNRDPVLTADVEPLVHQYIREKAIELGGEIFALNGITDHVHVVARIPASIQVSKFVGQIKAVSSLRLKRAMPVMEEFTWQREYAAISIGKPYMEKYIAYITHQRTHHERKEIHPALERTAGHRITLHEPPALYVPYTYDPDDPCFALDDVD